ncbi:15134_t:CDS:2, partial [Acaulospora morrowiae]
MSMITNLTNCRWEELTQILAGILYPMGFDLVKAFPAERYNSNIPSTSTLVPLPITNFRGSTSVQHNRSSTLSVIIGNTRHLWSIFIDYYAKNIRENIGDNQENASEERDTYEQSNPLDWYTRISIESAVKRAVSKFSKNASNLEYEIRYVFDLSEDKFVAFQQLAQDAGLAYYNRICYLNVHPEYGPWIGLRAVVTFDIDGPPKLYPTPGNPYPKGDQLLKTKMEEVLKNDNDSQFSSTSVTNVDKESVAKTNFDKQVIANIRRDWYKWVELRDIAGGFMTYIYKDMFRATSVFFLIACFVFGIHAANITIQVGQGGLKFVPQNITVNTGDTLIFNWANGGPHSVVRSDGPASNCVKSLRAGAFNSGQMIIGTFVYDVTETSGNIFYFCDVPSHCEEGGMWGVITVGGSSGNSSSTGATSNKSSASSTSTTIVTL